MSRIAAFASLTLALLPASVQAGTACEPFRLEEGSTLTFVAVQAGAAFTGRFEEFDAQITFSASDPEGCSFQVRVGMKSVATDYADRDEIIRGPDFFHVGRFPEARFVAREFSRTGAEKFVARGVLTIRDKAIPIELPFSFSRDAGQSARYVLSGRVPINRMDFGVGGGEWSDAKWVGHEVEVRFRLFLGRRPD